MLIVKWGKVLLQKATLRCHYSLYHLPSKGMSDTSSPHTTYSIVLINYSMSNNIILQLVSSVTLTIYLACWIIKYIVYDLKFYAVASTAQILTDGSMSSINME